MTKEGFLTDGLGEVQRQQVSGFKEVERDACEFF